MSAYMLIGNWLFLVGSVIFTIDSIGAVYTTRSLNALLSLVAAICFTSGCVFFLVASYGQAKR